MKSTRGFKNHELLNPYKGYIQEARTYLSYPFHSHRDPFRKFIVLSQHRSGSALLVSLLNSHPDIHCESILFYYRKMLPMSYLACRSRMSPKNVFGFKLMPNHIGYQGYKDAKQFILNVHQSGYSIIKLSRHNLLNSALSLLYAQKRGKYYYNRLERAQGLPKLTLDPSELLQKIDWLEQLATLQNQITETIPHLALVYEDDLENPTDQQTTVDRITQYLELPNVQVQSDIARITVTDHSEYIANFDEVLATLRDTGVEYRLA